MLTPKRLIGWLSCAIAEQLVVSTLESSSLTSGISAVVFERRRPSEKAAGSGASPIAYKVAKAAALVGMSRYLLYEAIRNQELRAFRPKPRADLMILAEDLREWVTRHPVDGRIPRHAHTDD